MDQSYKESPKQENFGLPESADEAGAFLQELWLARRKNKTQRESLGAMTETEREEFTKEYFRRKEIEPQFNWLAEMFGSETVWFQDTIETNYGRIFWFKFGDEDSPDEAPAVFVFYPNSHDYKDGVILMEKRDGWLKQDLQEFQHEYFKEEFGY